MLNVVQIGWNLCCDDGEAPIVANVGHDQTHEWKAYEDFLQRWERNFLRMFFAGSVLENIISLLLQDYSVQVLKIFDHNSQIWA